MCISGSRKNAKPKVLGRGERDQISLVMGRVRFKLVSSIHNCMVGGWVDILEIRQLKSFGFLLMVYQCVYLKCKLNNL